LAKTRKQELSAEESYLETYAHHRILSAIEEIDLIKKAQDGDDGAFRDLILYNQLLVLKIAHQYKNLLKNGSVEMMDLIQWGNIGLMTAIKKFDLSRRVRLSTYAVFWIRQEVRRNAMQKSASLSISVIASEWINKIAKSRSKLCRDLKREPTLTEISTDTGLSMDTVSELWTVYAGPLSLDKEVETGEGEITISEVIPDDRYERSDLEDGIDMKDLIAEVSNALVKLDKQSRKIISLFFGLDGENEHTLEEISALMGCSTETIRKKKIIILKDLFKYLDYSRSRRLWSGTGDKK
jgi:RNA polymerase primary sigma factor